MVSLSRRTGPVYRAAASAAALASRLLRSQDPPAASRTADLITPETQRAIDRGSLGFPSGKSLGSQRRSVWSWRL